MVARALFPARQAVRAAQRRLRALMPVVALLAAGLAAAPAYADDPRLVERAYDPGTVYTLVGQPKVQATIAFEEGEKIENVAIGDSNAWQVTPNKRASLLFVKPLATKAKTNMTVVTNKRTYLFDLVTSSTARPVYMLSFSYPDAPAPPQPETQKTPQTSGGALAAGAGLNATELAAAQDPYAVLDPSQLNFAWKRRGDGALLPARIFDDGSATFLAWPKDAALPAILITNDKGDEGPVNFTVRGDMVVISGVPEKIVLRMGKERAELIHAGPRPVAAIRAEITAPRAGLATLRELARSGENSTPAKGAK